MKISDLFVGLSVFVISVQALSAQDRDQRIQALEDQINALKAQVDKIKEDNRRPAWLDKIDHKGLTMNFYGETKWNVKNGKLSMDRTRHHAFG